jgi:hypothetical protein
MNYPFSLLSSGAGYRIVDQSGEFYNGNRRKSVSYEEGSVIRRIDIFSKGEEP